MENRRFEITRKQLEEFSEKSEYSNFRKSWNTKESVEQDVEQLEEDEEFKIYAKQEYEKITQEECENFRDELWELLKIEFEEIWKYDEANGLDYWINSILKNKKKSYGNS